MEQLSLFSINLGEEQPKFQVLDRVKIQLIDESIDSETYNYRKYYEPHIINKVGEITNITLGKNGVTYEVDIYGERYYMLEDELIAL